MREMVESTIKKTSSSGLENLMEKLQECLILLKEPRTGGPDSSEEISKLTLVLEANTNRFTFPLSIDSDEN